MFNLTQKDIDTAWRWYAVPAIVVTLLIFNLILCSDRHEIEPSFSGVDRAEVVSRWEETK